MKIAVCIKRVPDTEVRFAIGTDRKSIDPTGLKFDLSDFDGYAIEVALRLKEQQGGGEVVALSLGPDGTQEILRKALSMGIDRAVHLQADAIPFDALSIARALVPELEGQGFELILFGRNATDTGNACVGPMTAELLGMPCVTAVSHLELSEARGIAQRELEGVTETVSFPLPAVLTIDEGIARPRLPSLKGIMAAKKKPIDVRPAQLGEIRLSVQTLELPPERAGGRIVGEGPEAVPELVRLLRDEAKVL
ncbi:MAG TPA: electron transfer flavoprotein subunit beta/FixA family protein [Gemmatimonadales bacterium]|nr:electron transfer flavoprotein subunit beta/FixA family protein [Gemmatimonadales bacterium]